ncbi:MAG TPA: AP endonuclease [Euryarchaeota archaeon]|nr:AP endonuclease [Euryarchaeota archaeon]
MIRFGPAGIPLSCKGRTLIDGIEDVHSLGLTAIELQLVRMNIIDRYAMEDEVGLTPRDITTDLIVQIIRGEEDPLIITDLSETIQDGDLLVTLISGIAPNWADVNFARDLAKKLDITLSLHSPYYMDLTQSSDVALPSVEILRWGGLIASEMGASPLVIHLGLYEGRDEEDAINNIVSNLASIIDWYEENNVNVVLGLETSGRQEVFGSVDEIIRICDEVEGVIPIINVPHIHSRENGSLMTKEDFEDLFAKLDNFTKSVFYVHFSGVEHEDGNEIRYTPIKKGDLRFEPMAEAMIEHLYEMTIISGSPLLEHDAMYMRVIFERNYTRQVQKLKRMAEKEEETRIEEERLAKEEEGATKDTKSAPKKKSGAKVVTKKPTGKKTPPKPAQAKKASAKKKSASKKIPEKKEPVEEKTAPKKAPAKKKSASKKIPEKKEPVKTAVKKAPAKSPAKKGPTKAKPSPAKTPSKKKPSKKKK